MLGLQNTGQIHKQGGFATTIGTQDTGDRVLTEIQRQIVQYLLILIAET